MSFLKNIFMPAPVIIAKGLIKKTNGSDKLHGQHTIVFRETDAFYTELDELVKTKKKIIIKFRDDKLGKESPLWKRLGKCKNWEAAADTIQTDSVVASKFVQPSVVCALTGYELVLIGYVATLIFGLGAYAIYKGRKVTIKGNKGDSDGEIIIE